MDRHDSPRIKFIPRKRLQALTGLSRSSTYNRNNPRSESFDPAFPKPVNLSSGPGGRGPIGFVESEVYAWMEARVNAARLKTQINAICGKDPQGADIGQRAIKQGGLNV